MNEAPGKITIVDSARITVIRQNLDEIEKLLENGEIERVKRIAKAVSHVVLAIGSE